MALLQAPDSLVDLRFGFEFALLDPPLQLLQVGQQSRFVLFADRPILGLSTLAQAEDMGFLACRSTLDEDCALLLGRVSR